jgi:hypothetical protein
MLRLTKNVKINILDVFFLNALSTPQGLEGEREKEKQEKEKGEGERRGERGERRKGEGERRRGLSLSRP